MAHHHRHVTVEPDGVAGASVRRDNAPAARKTVVVVGAGFGGVNVAKHLKHSAADICIVDKNNSHVFQPLLYQVAMSGLSAEDIAQPVRSLLGGQKNTQVVMAEVSGADLTARQVILRDGRRLAYDYLVLAMGAETSYFGNDRWAPYTFQLKTLEDALAIRERMLWAFEQAELESDPLRRCQLLTFVVVGAGPTGVEIAGSLAELARRVLAKDFQNIDAGSCHVILMERSDRVLLPFAPELSRKAHAQLRQLGVDVRLNTVIEDIDAGGVRLQHGDYVPAGMTLWTAGVQPVSLVRRLGVPLDKRGRVVVQRDCSVPGHPEVFAIGDMAAFTASDGTVLPGLAPVAIQQGRFVADCIARELSGKARGEFRYRDKGIMSTIGRARAIVQTSRVKLSGLFAWYIWLVVHIWYLIGFRNRLAVLLQWLWAYVFYRPGARVIVRSWLSNEAPPPPKGVVSDEQV